MNHNDPVEAPSSHSPVPAASETPQDAREVERRDQVVEAAYQEVFRLCEGGRWQMTIPVRPDRDSDLLIVAGLDALVKRAEDAEAERDAVYQSFRRARLTALRDASTAWLMGCWEDALSGADQGTVQAVARWLSERGRDALATRVADAQDEATHA